MKKQKQNKNKTKKQTKTKTKTDLQFKTQMVKVIPKSESFQNIPKIADDHKFGTEHA